MDIIIKRTFDEELVRRLHKETFPADDFYESEKNIYWVAIAKYSSKPDEPVGFAIMTEIDKSIVFLSRAGVVWKARGKGLQKRLIRVRVNHAKKMGYKKAITYTAITNISSFVNLLKCKFKPYLPEYSYAGKFVNYLIKEL